MASGHPGRAAASGHRARAGAWGRPGRAAALGHLGRAAASGHRDPAAAGYLAHAGASDRPGLAEVLGRPVRAAASGHRAHAAASGHRAHAGAAAEVHLEGAVGRLGGAVVWAAAESAWRCPASSDGTRYNIVARRQAGTLPDSSRGHPGNVASCRRVTQILAMLIDVHAHFYHDRAPRADWRERNASRLRAGERIGITIHVASILGSWGRTSPIYFPSPADLEYGNAALLALEREHPDRIRGYVTVNPNYTVHARAEIARGLAAGMIGIKLAASRRANDPLLDPICEVARERGVPVLQHVWQHRRRDWPGQEASDAVELCALAARHPMVRFVLAHIGGGGDWRHSLAVLRRAPNVYVDLSGSGVDGGMLEGCLAAVGAERLLWGTDLTMETGWAKLRYLERLLSGEDLEKVKWKNAAQIFPHGGLPAD